MDGNAVCLSGLRAAKGQAARGPAEILCKHVFVDPEKAVVQDVAKVTAEDISEVRGTTVLYRDAASVEPELPVARKASLISSVVLGEISRVVKREHHRQFALARGVAQITQRGAQSGCDGAADQAAGKKAVRP